MTYDPAMGRIAVGIVSAIGGLGTVGWLLWHLMPQAGGTNFDKWQTLGMLVVVVGIAVGVAAMLKSVTATFDKVFDAPFPYSMGLHPQPYDSVEHPEWHFHLHFYPPLLRSATVRSKSAPRSGIVPGLSRTRRSRSSTVSPEATTRRYQDAIFVPSPAGSKRSCPMSLVCHRLDRCSPI